MTMYRISELLSVAPRVKDLSGMYETTPHGLAVNISISNLVILPSSYTK